MNIDSILPSIKFSFLLEKLIFIYNFILQSGSASPDHYHDIESLTLTLGKTRPGRKTSKDKRQSSIWTDSLENKSSTLKQPKPKIASSTPTNPKPKSKKGEQATKDLSENKTFLENPLLTTDKNWSLPRVELWCRDPNCGKLKLTNRVNIGYSLV